MSADLWWSLGLGGGIALLYSIISYAVDRRALRASRSRFVKILVGGMLVRMALVLVLLTLVLLFVSVRVGAFIGSFIVLFFAGLLVEVLRLHHRQKADRN